MVFNKPFLKKKTFNQRLYDWKLDCYYVQTNKLFFDLYG